MRSEKMDLFGGGNDLESVANEIYGGSVDIPDSGRVVARPTAISLIWADVKQPRRAIPINIRLHWDGNPASVPQLLEDWQMVAIKESGWDINVKALLNGEGEGIDTDKFPSVSQEYMALVRLAQGIKADGLINPITIIESDSKLLIESGERRWLAYHLLNMYLGETWAKIPSAKGNTNDSVWRQATENTQRRALNAIGMARQIALLIMAARGTPPMASGTQYQEYDEIVKNGASDRRFYAQVADGNVHRIPRGMGERIQAAMGLGMEQISQYRRLLRLTEDEMVNDALWTRADVENWPEGWLRDVSTLTPVKVSDVIQRPNWTIDDLRALKEAPVTNPYPNAVGRFTPQPQPPATTEWMNKTVRTPGGQMGKVVGMDGDWITVSLEPTGKRQAFLERNLTIIASDVGHRPSVTPTPQPQHTGTNADPFSHVFAIGDKVRTRTGSQGEVVGISGRLVTVKTVNGTMVHDWSGLVKVEKPQDPPQLREEDIEEDVDPETKPHVREWSEGISIGGNNLDTDKASSQATTPQDIFPYDSLEFAFLDALSDVARATGEEQVDTMLQWVGEIKDVDAKTLLEQGQLKERLDEAYAMLANSMTGWLQVTFSNMMRRIEETAVS